MSIKNKLFATVLLAVLQISVVAFGLYYYNTALKDDLTVSVYETLAEVTEQQKFNFNSKISTDISAIKNLAILANSLSGEKEEAVRTINELVKNSNFEYITIADTQGHALVSDGTILDISQDEHFLNAMEGQTAICNPKKSKIRDAVIVPISTPIYRDGKIVGVMAGSYTAERLRDLFLPSFNGKGFVYVTDSEGNIVVKPQNEYALIVNRYGETNLYDGFTRAEVSHGYETPEEMRQNLLQGRSGYTKVSIDGNSEFVSYAPSGVNDWNIFVVVPEAYIASRATVIAGRASIFAAVVIVVFVLFVLYALFMQHRGRKEREAHTKQLEQLAYYDEVTGLPNLTRFKMDVGDILDKNPNTSFFVAKMDIVNFKMINELFGFETGDKVVMAVAGLIRQVRNKSGAEVGALTRVNADEFLLMDSLEPGVEELIERAEVFEESFNKYMTPVLGNHRVEFRYSVYFLEEGETDITGAIEKANIAHHIVKSQKNSNICFYDDVFKQQIMRETEIENQMEAALANQEFKVYLQPKYDLKEETVVGAEALVRWQTDEGPVISPNDFIPLFERNGFIVKLDMYMFEHVCEIIKGWLDDGKAVVPVSVNFSRAHLANSSFVSQLEELADRFHVPKKYLEIELTESVILDNEELLEDLLNNLHSLGFKLSMDDFGIGYSSLGLLKNLPVDVVKIDRSFFVNNRYKSRAKIVIESVMGMAKKLKILTVAEGVESKDHIDLLREVGCDVIQGYYYAKPMPAEAFHDSDRQFVRQKAEPKEPLFDLKQLGDLDIGRTSLGPEMPVAVYRLFQFTLREALTHMYGEGEAQEIFKAAGEKAGRAYAQGYLDLSASFDDFIAQLRESLENSKIGILDLEKMDGATNTMVITVRDDLDCSGTSDLSKTLCQYDEGFIAGVLYEYTKTEYSVKEVDCWGTGADVCRFHVTPI